MSALVIMPVLVPLLAAAIGLVAWRRPGVQACVGVGGAAAQLLTAVALLAAVNEHGYVVTQVGRWAAPFGITFAADTLGAVMVCLAGTMGLVVAVYSLHGVGEAQRHAGYYPLLHVLLMGVCGAFLTGDIFNLYVWFEVLLIASFGLMGIAGDRTQLEGTTKYLVLNLFGSMVFLMGAGVLYATVGTLNMADLSVKLDALSATHPSLVMAIAAMFAIAFASKAAMFPLFFWLPASYHTPPAAVCAVFAALLTKVGVVSLVRLFALVFTSVEPVVLLVLVATTVTMVSGVLGAVSQYEIKRILAWHSVSQVGYIVVGVGLLVSGDERVRALGLAATVVFLVHHGLVKPALFLIGGLVERRAGSSELKLIGGQAVAAPWLAALFFVSALSLAGLPPSSGFWAKLAVIRAGLVGEQYGVVAAALAAGLLTTLSMIKIWNEAFWKVDPGKVAAPGAPLPVSMVAPTAALVLFIALLGFVPQPLLALADRAAAQLNNPAGYVRAVQGFSRQLDETPGVAQAQPADTEPPR